jgi:hypothetical protein
MKKEDIRTHKVEPAIVGNHQASYINEESEDAILFKHTDG